MNASHSFFYLIRHAEAKDPKPGQTDFSRELTENGWKEAELQGKVFRSLGFSAPDVIFTSGSARTEQTIAAMDVVQPQTQVVKSRSFYHDGDVRDIDSEMRAYWTEHTKSGKAHNIAVVSHNPLISELTFSWVGEAWNVIQKFPRGGVMIMQFSQWDDLKNKRARLKAILPRPKIK